MKKVVHFIIIGLIFLLILEVFLRFSGKLKTYSEKNFGVYTSAYQDSGKSHIYVCAKNDTINSQQTEFQFQYITNEYGFLRKHYYEEENKDTTLIFLGDSFVFGVGAEHDSNVVSLLENKLDCKIINAGIPGSDPFYQKVLIDSIFYPLGYRKYIFMVNFSDFYDYIFRGGAERFLPNNEVAYRKAPFIEPYYEKTLLVRALTHTLLQRDFSLLTKKRSVALKKKAIDAYVNLFLSLSKEIDLVVVLQPYAKQYATNNQIEYEVLNFKYLEKMQAKLDEINIKTINLDSLLKEQINNDNYLSYSWKLDGHFNAKGYNLLANGIANELARKYPFFLNLKK